MRIALAEKIMKMINIQDHQLMYKIADMIIEDIDDFIVIEKTIKRDLMDIPKCKKCKIPMEAIFSFNGTLDYWICPKTDLTGKHKT